MPQEPVINPETLHKTAKELYEQKTAPEKEPQRELNEREQKVKQEIIKETGAPQAQPQSSTVIKAVNDLLSLDDQTQLGELIKMAFSKNVAFALNVARGLNNPLVLDTFHDLLAKDELYYTLVSSKKI